MIITGCDDGDEKNSLLPSLSAPLTSSVPDFGSATIAAPPDWTGDASMLVRLQYYTGEAIDPVILPAARGGDKPLVYSLSPDLAVVGLTFDAVARILSGRPTRAMAETLYTYTATDADGDRASLSFTIQVDVDQMPDFGSQTIAPQPYRTGDAISTLTLPAASGGDGTLTYSLTPALPNGLSFNPDAAARTLSGTPTTMTPERSYTYTATDADGDRASLSFTIQVDVDQMPDFGSPRPPLAAQIYRTGDAISTLTLPAASGGDGTLTYSLTPALPNGLSFNPDAAARTLSGTPTTMTPERTYTYTARDEDNDTASLTFTIRIDDVVFDETIFDRRYRAGLPISTLTLPAAQGRASQFSYSLTPSLPEGLTFDNAADVRILSGTAPNREVLETTYTYMATGNNGDKGSLEFTITVLFDTSADPINIELDLINTPNKICWINRAGRARIQRANLDRTNVEDIASLTAGGNADRHTGANHGLYGSGGFAIDLVNNKIYWSILDYVNNSSSPRAPIWRANLDGNNLEVFIEKDLSNLDITHLAVDPRGNYLYFVVVEPGTVLNSLRRTTLGGDSMNNIEEILSNENLGALYKASQ